MFNKTRYPITKAGKQMPRNKGKSKRRGLAPQSYACIAILTGFGCKYTGQSNFSFRHILTELLTAAVQHSAKQHWEQWFFNYVVTAIWTVARLMTELQVVFSTASELTGVFQSQANKSHSQQNTTAAASCSLCMPPALLQSLGHRTSGDTHWIAQEITQKACDSWIMTV